MGRAARFPRAARPGNYFVGADVSVFLLFFFFVIFLLVSVVSWAKETVPSAMPRPSAITRSLFIYF